MRVFARVKISGAVLFETQVEQRLKELFQQEAEIDQGVV